MIVVNNYLTINEQHVTLSARQDVRPLYGRTANEHWRYTDKAGHEHSYVEDPDDHYPTLICVEGFVWCDCCEACYDGDAVEHYECRICGEEILPGTRDAVYYSVDRTGYCINEVPVSKAEYERVLDVVMAAHSEQVQ